MPPKKRGRRNLDNPVSNPLTTTTNKAQAATARRLTPAQRTMFVGFLRDRLRQYHHVTDERVLRKYLEYNTWHVTRAFDHILRDREILGSPTSHTDTNDAAGLRAGLRARLRTVPFNNNLEQERRNAAFVLRQQVNAGRGVEEQIDLTGVEAILLLHLTNWDIGRAVDEFTTHEGLLARLHVEFDSMRSDESVNTPTNNERQRQERQDERLALLLTITMRPDWYSVRVFLAQYNWDLIRALTAWFRTVIPPTPHRKDRKGVGRRMDHNLRRLPMPHEDDTKPTTDKDTESVWPKERKEFMKAEDYAGGYKKVPLREVRKRAHGFLINEDRDPVQPAEAPDPSKYLIEYIKAGKYYSNRMKRDYFTWPELESSEVPADGDIPNDCDSSSSDDDDGKDDDNEEPPKKRAKIGNASRKDGLDASKPVPFDFGNKAHIAQLNQWRRENLSRATGVLRRRRAQQWTEEELDFLYDLHMELLQKRTKATGKREDEVLPMVVQGDVFKEWTRRLNAKFGGRVMREGEEPRYARLPAALNTQRARTPKIVERFKLPGDQVYMNRQKQRQEKREKKKKEQAEGKGKKDEEGQETDEEEAWEGFED